MSWLKESRSYMSFGRHRATVCSVLLTRRARRPLDARAWVMRVRDTIPTGPHQRLPHRTAPGRLYPSRSRYDREVRTVVVGSGVMGAWTALWLRRRGHVVTLVDRFGPGNQVGSSGDESRITRSSHGP